MIKTHQGTLVVDTTTETAFTEVLLRTEAAEAHIWICTTCHLVGYGFMAQDGALTAGILHAREEHPLQFADLASQPGPMDKFEQMFND